MTSFSTTLSSPAETRGLSFQGTFRCRSRSGRDMAAMCFGNERRVGLNQHQPTDAARSLHQRCLHRPLFGGVA